MSSPEEFSRRMARLGVRVAEGADQAVRRCALAVDAAVVTATPVKTGRARSNWIASLNAGTNVNREPLAPGAAATQPAIDEAAAVVATYDGDRDQSIHITNSVPYIGKLNSGSSQQAPAEFVQEATEAGVSAVAGARILD